MPTDLSTTRERVAEFEQIIESAKRALWAADPPEIAESFLAHDPVLQWRLLDLLERYQAAGVYPLERLPGVMDRLIDSKLEFYYVSQVLPGTLNALVYGRGFEHDDPLARPGLQLARLCYSQAMIGQSRILWDRLMRAIYYLEAGADPEGKSIRRRFFRELPSWSPRWDLVAEFETEIDDFDSSYRTPEYHKGSVLRRELLGGDVVDPDEMLALLAPVMNGLWTILMANIEGSPHNLLRLGHRVRSS